MGEVRGGLAAGLFPNAGLPPSLLFLGPLPPLAAGMAGPGVQVGTNCSAKKSLLPNSWCCHCRVSRLVHGIDCYWLSMVKSDDVSGDSWLLRPQSKLN